MYYYNSHNNLWSISEPDSKCLKWEIIKVLANEYKQSNREHFIQQFFFAEKLATSELKVDFTEVDLSHHNFTIHSYKGALICEQCWTQPSLQYVNTTTNSKSQPLLPINLPIGHSDHILEQILFSSTNRK